MISDEAAVSAALAAADEGLARGEMPIGAAVFLGDQQIATAWTQEKQLRRRIVHADLLALQAADEILGFTRKSAPLTLAVNLEPCLMCLGAAITLGVAQILYALPSPNDGGIETLSHWNPPVELPYFKKPHRIVAGIHQDRARDQFVTYANGTGPASMRAWARDLATPHNPNPQDATPPDASEGSRTQQVPLRQMRTVGVGAFLGVAGPALSIPGPSSHPAR